MMLMGLITFYWLDILLPNYGKELSLTINECLFSQPKTK